MTVSRMRYYVSVTIKDSIPTQVIKDIRAMRDLPWKSRHNESHLSVV